MDLLITLVALAAYLTVGWLLALCNVPRAWTIARDRWASDTSIAGSVKMQTIGMLLCWPWYFSFRTVSDRLGEVIDARDPEALQDKIAERDARIRQLERELRMPQLRSCCQTPAGSSHLGTCPQSAMNTGRWNP